MSSPKVSMRLLENVLRQRDEALARAEKAEARAAKLHAALRLVAVEGPQGPRGWSADCKLCGGEWVSGNPERHAVGCLAVKKVKP